MNRIELTDIIKTYGTRAGYPEEGISSLCKDTLVLSDAAMDYLSDVCEGYEQDNKLSYAMQEEFEKISAPVHCYGAQMIFYMALLPALEAKYGEKKLPAAYFDGVLFDLRAKLLECKTVYDIWGSFVAVWFSRFFHFVLYGIERLEFAPYHADYDYEGQGVSIKKGDFVIDVHIPSGAPLPHEAVMRSYRKAAEHYGTNVFVCESWMLYPAHAEMLAECPNLMAFFRDYDVVESGQDRGDLWRIFGADHEKAPSDLPTDTALRRVYAARLQAGLPVGWGKGIFVLK